MLLYSIFVMFLSPVDSVKRGRTAGKHDYAEQISYQIPYLSSWSFSYTYTFFQFSLFILDSLKTLTDFVKERTQWNFLTFEYVKILNTLTVVLDDSSFYLSAHICVWWR